MGELKNYIRELAENKDLEIYSTRCEVLSVDPSQRTADLKPLDDSAEIYGARIQATLEATEGLYLEPKVGSTVVATFLSKEAAYISLYTEVDKVVLKTPEIEIESDSITINGGEQNGLIILSKLKAEIDKLNANFDTIKNAWSSATPVPNDGGAAIKTAISTALSALQEADLSDVEDEKVKH